MHGRISGLIVTLGIALGLLVHTTAVALGVAVIFQTSQYAFAATNGHTNSAIKALELLSRVRGANSDVNPNLDSETLEGAIIGCLNVLGEDVVLGMLSKCDFADSLFSEEDLEDMSTESLLESVTEGVVDPTYPEDTTSPVTGLEENT